MHKTIAIAVTSLSFMLLGACGGGKPDNSSPDGAAAARIEEASETAAARIEKAVNDAIGKVDNTLVGFPSDAEREKLRADSFKLYSSFLELYATDKTAAAKLLADKAGSGQLAPGYPHTFVNHFDSALGYSAEDPLKEFLRAQLKDPNTLRLMYRLVDDNFFRKVLTDVGIDAALTWRTDGLIVLQKPFNPQLMVVYGAWHKCQSNPDGDWCGQDRTGHDRFVSLFKETYGVEPNYTSGWMAGWLGRRFGEGGAPLVDAWREILRDAARRIG